MSPAIAEVEPVVVISPVQRVRRRRLWVIPALLLTLYVGECLWFVHSQSITFDEPIHLYSGLRAWHGRFDMWNENPPLARLLFSLPLVVSGTSMQFDMMQSGPQITRMTHGPIAVAWLTRPFNIVLGVLLGIALWCAAARMFSSSAANFVLTLFVLSPGMIAHFSIATIDGIGALATFVAAVALAYWRRLPTLGNTILLGCAVGLLLLSKFYTLPLAMLALALVFTHGADGRFVLRPRDWNWRQGLAVSAIAMVLVWASYGFHVTRVQMHDDVFTATIPGAGSPYVGVVPFPVNFTVWLPAGEYMDGLRLVADHNRNGHINYLFGQISRRGWLYYTPAVMALKWPAIILAMFAISIWLMARRRLKVEREFLIIAAFPALFFLITLFSHIQIGDRHLLPMYPFLLLAIAGLWCWAGRRRFGRAVLLCLLALQAVDTARIAPDWLSYFNAWVRPDGAYKMLSDSNLDWGEGLLELRDWQQRHGDVTLQLAYMGSVDPALYGVHYKSFAPGERVTGAVAVSMSNIAGQYLPDPDAYKWLLQYPHETVNHSIFVFHVPKSSLTQ